MPHLLLEFRSVLFRSLTKMESAVRSGPAPASSAANAGADARKPTQESAKNAGAAVRSLELDLNMLTPFCWGSVIARHSHSQALLRMTLITIQTIRTAFAVVKTMLVAPQSGKAAVRERECEYE